jgi:hypothetical protein
MMRDFARAAVIVVTLLFLMAEAELFDVPAPASTAQTDF